MPIALDGLGIEMRFPVQFDDQTDLVAREVDHERSERNLSAETAARE
ncbi:hypothetical protein PRN20_06615 [Devosia sp. ZB163]|nr:hypothetical protein [Devosia sp. ZB163]MDC9823399.1 hypothetical protein [Devosia sp. ZB163]